MAETKAQLTLPLVVEAVAPRLLEAQLQQQRVVLVEMGQHLQSRVLQSLEPAEAEGGEIRLVGQQAPAVQQLEPTTRVPAPQLQTLAQVAAESAISLTR